MIVTREDGFLAYSRSGVVNRVGTEGRILTELNSVFGGILGINKVVIIFRDILRVKDNFVLFCICRI